MPTKIITMYCFFDEFLKALGHRDDPQCHLSTAEVMTIAAVAAEFFVGNHQKALDFLTRLSEQSWLHQAVLQESVQSATAPHSRNALAVSLVCSGANPSKRSS
jgi:putative SOS response-associated peptidase YedK